MLTMHDKKKTHNLRRDLIEVKWCEGYNVLENKEIDGNMVPMAR